MYVIFIPSIFIMPGYNVNVKLIFEYFAADKTGIKLLHSDSLGVDKAKHPLPCHALSSSKLCFTLAYFDGACKGQEKPNCSNSSCTSRFKSYFNR